jgi:predicted dehydrogenase
MNRRSFLKASTVTGAGLLILPSGSLFGQATPGKKLNIAVIGVWGRALAHLPVLAEENIVALCDIHGEHLAEAAAKFPKAKTYVDWRKCLEQKDIEAVVCCTPEHHHAFIALWAMNRGMHVFMEKPLGNTVEEVRLVRAAYLAKKDKLCTQCGTQRHANPNFRRVRELITRGAIGELDSVHAFGNRQLRRPGYLPAAGSPPAHLNWDLWLGPSPAHPYNPGYFSGKAGANCLEWNMYWDFGTGQVGDMGSHVMDLAYSAIDATLPTSAEGSGEAYNPEVTPVELTTHFEHPANSWRPAVRVSWYQGGHLPKTPKAYLDLAKVGHGVMFKGSKGFLVSDFESRVLMPFGNNADLTYYKSPAEADLEAPIGNFQKQWIDGCKGGNLKTSCNFEYSSLATEQMLLGLVAYRVGKKIQYDGATGRVTNSPEANAFLRRDYRAGWALNG